MEEVRCEGVGGSRVQEGKSFKGAVLGEEEMGSMLGEGTSPKGVHSVIVVAKEVVWEVEVEDERVASMEDAYVGYLVEDKQTQTIQNNFRIGGFQSLKVTTMGHKQVLVWSDKVHEVKELRCFGVPIHAWGMDLFRALDFMYGRFIEIDDNTAQLMRCDVARVKVVTKELKIIDSVMVVKVRGKRFKIRVIEETGDWLSRSSEQEVVIQNAGRLNEGRWWQWNLMWRKERFQWEEDQYSEFVEIIAPFVPSENLDKWLWLGDGIQGFTVKSAYCRLENMVSNRRILELAEDFVLKRLWKCASPFNVRAFVWQLLLDRVQTKDNLFKRKMLDADQQLCVLCGKKNKIVVHLYLHCDCAAKVWYDIIRWLGFNIIIPPNLFTSFAMWATCAPNKKEKVGLCLIWNAFM
ncbi:hypothetical protein TSUD_286790 [Trifolium subterraneum]|uniref:Reverse transcriptase zinc-binding domain-containing protein n=1 Tax=Trifolium subterraneum TaxID=3900 RepID=A0A2Z6MQP3_TRISU|nr:hypothetical protein TSUD_286790 [Trifolium subterraneum]